jgi:hypothetical protein
VAFITKEYTNLSRKELTAAVNKRYGLKITERQMESFVKNHKICSGRTGYFEKGHKSWNAGTNGICKPNSGCFRKGHMPANIRHLGAERKETKQGYTLIKVTERNPYTGAPTRFREKHIVLWEQAHGRVPPGKCVVFVDGDNRHISIDNLVLIDRALHARLNRNHYAKSPEEIKPSIIALSKLQTAMGRRKRNKE